MKIRLVFDIDPYPKRTGKINNRGKFARIAPNSKTVAFQKQIATIAKNKYKGPVVEGPIQAKVIFFIKKPKSVKRHYPSVKPDLDNLSKSLMDALQEIIFKNDSQIIDMTLSKRYSDKGKIIVNIERI